MTTHKVAAQDIKPGHYIHAHGDGARRVVVSRPHGGLWELQWEGFVGGVTYPGTNFKVHFPNARFWVWEHGGWVKLTLRPGQTLRYCNGGPHDEGYSWTGVEYEYDADDMVVVCRSSTYASDCDGPIEKHHECQCAISELAFVQPPGAEECGGEWFPWRPNWQRVSASQRDHFAESMGY